MRHASGLCWIVLSAVAALVSCVPRPAYGGSDLFHAVPIGPKTTVNGLAIQIESSWPECRGYRPVRLQVTCSPPATADRTLSVELGMGPHAQRNLMRVATEIEIPAGSATVTKVLSVPQYTLSQIWSLTVWEDGLRLDDLCIEYGNTSISDIGAWGVPELPAILFVTSASHNLKPLEMLAESYGNVGSPRNYPQGNSPNAFADVSSVATFAEQPVEKLPENWINYSGVDLVFLPLADVQSLATKRPEAWRALREWTCAGGNLCVYGVGDDWHALAELEVLLKIPEQSVYEKDTVRGWRKAALQSVAPPTAALAQIAGLALPQSGASLAKMADDEVPFVVRPLMLGQVAALASDQPFPGERASWQLLFDTLEPAHWNWRSRHGLTCDNTNPDFDNYLIGEVGLPPVGAYRVLITFFVLGICPLNYWLLRRSGRLHLLLFTVPAAALLVSVALVGYVFVADGLTSRLRARSYTEIDQRSGQAVSWARLSYYAGLAPADGLKFSDDVVVLPFEKAPEWTERGARSRTVEWGESQHLSRGWLNARTPTQYLTVRAYQSPRRLKFASTTGSQDLALRNELGTRIKFLTVRGQTGESYFARDIEPGAAIRLTPFGPATSATSDAFGAMMGAFRADTPATPAQIAAMGLDAFGRRRNRRGRYFIQSQTNLASTTSLLELTLKAASSTAPFSGLEPGSYVAIVERPTEIEAGFGNPTESQGLHVIRGKW